jgi:outer membrane immunogenic protein
VIARKSSIAASSEPKGADMKAIPGIIASVAALLAGPAIAADMPVKVPPMPPALPSWTGFYFGINAGGSFGADTTSQNTSFTSAALGSSVLLNSTAPLAAKGWLAGGQFGYNWQVAPSYVLGVEADWQWTSQRGAETNCSPPVSVGLFGPGGGGFGYCSTMQEKLTSIGTARARAGTLVNDFLWYATGGFAWGTLKDSYAFNGSANPTIFTGAFQPGPFLPSSADFSSTRTGWTVGGGVETRLSGGWSAKLEYLYVDLGTISQTYGIALNGAFGPAVSSGSALVTSSSHIIDNIVRIGLNYKPY